MIVYMCVCVQILAQGVGAGRARLFERVLDGFVSAPLTQSSGCAVAKLVGVANRSISMDVGNVTDVRAMQELLVAVRAAQEALTPVSSVCVCVLSLRMSSRFLGTPWSREGTDSFLNEGRRGVRGGAWESRWRT